MPFRKCGHHLRGFLGISCLSLPPSETPSALQRCGWMSSSSTTTLPGPRPRGGHMESKCPPCCHHPAAGNLPRCFCSNAELNTNGRQKLMSRVNASYERVICGTSVSRWENQVMIRETSSAHVLPLVWVQVLQIAQQSLGESPEVLLAVEKQENNQILDLARCYWKGVSALYSGSLPFILWTVSSSNIFKYFLIWRNISISGNVYVFVFVSHFLILFLSLEDFLGITAESKSKLIFILATLPFPC